MATQTNGTVKTAKTLVYERWLEAYLNGNDQPSARELHTTVAGDVEPTTIYAWFSKWRRGESLPKGA